MIITIDGPAGSGKSTVAGLLAKKLGFIHFNSGSLYRAITAYLYEQNYNIKNLTTNSIIPQFNLKVNIKDGIQHIFVNNKDYTPFLRENHISTLVSFIALNKECRNKVDKCQKKFCSNNNVVIDGRDTGSFVFPNAEIKFYLDCSIAERARRRYLEVKVENPDTSIKDIEKQLCERDEIDKTRDVAPLVVPKEAIIIDSSNLTIDEVVNTLLTFIK